jgi:hypothetical protein
LKTLLFLLLISAPAVLLAGQIFDKEEDQYVPQYDVSTDTRDLRIEGMPEYPRDENLRKLNIRHPRSIYYVDISSIDPTRDNVVRLVSVSVSPSGARNVIYEGFDCGYRRFRQYGYGGSDQVIHPFREQEWKPVIDEGDGRYRAQLVDNYLCNGFAYAASRKKILARMKRLQPYSE